MKVYRLGNKMIGSVGDFTKIVATYLINPF